MQRDKWSIKTRIRIRPQSPGSADLVVSPQTGLSIEFIVKPALLLIARATVGEADDNVLAEAAGKGPGQRLADQFELRLHGSLAEHDAGAEPDVGPEAHVLYQAGDWPRHAEQGEDFVARHPRGVEEVHLGRRERPGRSLKS